MKEFQNSLLKLVIEPISFCNLKCKMCAYPKMERKKGKMDFTLFKKIIDEVSEFSPNTEI